MRTLTKQMSIEGQGYSLSAPLQYPRPLYSIDLLQVYIIVAALTTSVLYYSIGWRKLSWASLLVLASWTYMGNMVEHHANLCSLQASLDDGEVIDPAINIVTDSKIALFLAFVWSMILKFRILSLHLLLRLVILLALQLKNNKTSWHLLILNNGMFASNTEINVMALL